MSRPEKTRLGEILLKQGLIDKAELDEALTERSESGARLGKVLVEHGYVTEDQISRVLADQLQIPYINLKFYPLRLEAVHLLPEILARRFHAIVLEDRKYKVLVGMADPTDLFAYDEISRSLKRDIELAVVNEDLLVQTIDRMYQRTEQISGLAHELNKDLGEELVDFGTLPIGTGAEDAPVVKLLQTVFEAAALAGASDIHIEPMEHSLQIRFRIDGVLHLETEAASNIAPALALRLKLISGLDISEKRLPQDGSFNFRVRDQIVDVRISTMPTEYGESVVMRLLSLSRGMLTLERLGMPPEMLERFRQIIHRPNGMVLVTGPTGSGKTTTLYAALTELNNLQTNIITVEDPVEYHLAGINQIQINEKIDLSFGRVLRSVLRQDPDIILVGEMRDQETALIGLRAAMTGHMVFSTLHTNNAASTPVRLMDMGVPRYMVSSSLHVVLAQRLLRINCESCSEPYVPKPNEIAWLEQVKGITVEQGRYIHGKGCPHCNESGFQGRTGIYEMLEMTKELAEAANHHDPAEFMQAAIEHMQGHTLSHHAADLAISGRTTVAEAMRVSSQYED
jgi:MSHA biogenesis protein MshE